MVRLRGRLFPFPPELVCHASDGAEEALLVAGERAVQGPKLHVLGEGKAEGGEVPQSIVKSVAHRRQALAGPAAEGARVMEQVGLCACGDTGV